MLVNMTDVFTSEGRTVEREIAFSCEEFVHEGGRFPVKESGPVFLKLTNTAPGKALAEAQVKLALAIPCDRCLKEVEYPFELSIAREVVSPDQAGPEEAEEQEAFMEGYMLNVDRLIDDEITTSWPMKVLCRPDCKGLCPVCGKDLNTGACGCDTFVPDPRMAAIMDVFNANKEV
ncbi:MAG: DUF177 domain-containing protein [Eubacteriales bacterium]|nr:DUF177 domain-containing protein [Eubacteriales bacterium]